MTYAVSATGFRAINSAADLLAGETFSATQPALPTPDAKEPIRAQIRTLLNTAGVSQTWHLDGLMAGVLALGMGQGMTEPEVYAINPGYRDIKDLRGAIALLEAQL